MTSASKRARRPYGRLSSPLNHNFHPITGYCRGFLGFGLRSSSSQSWQKLSKCLTPSAACATKPPIRWRAAPSKLLYSTYSAVLYRQPTWVKDRNPQCTYHIREPMQMRFQSTQALCCIAHHCMPNRSLDHTTKNNEKRAMSSIYIRQHWRAKHVGNLECPEQIKIKVTKADIIA